MPSQVSRVCPVCGAAEAAAFLRKGELSLVRCRECGMIYANPAPAEMVSGTYYDDQGVDYYLSPEKLQADYSPVRFERELGVFRRYCETGAVLDVGCSSGAFLFQLENRHPDDYEVAGTDVSGAPLDHAESRGVRVIRGDFLAVEWREAFDAVTFWAVLEHLLEPGRFLARARELLQPGGLCFVLVPNMRSLAARLLGGKYRYIYPQHLNYFTPATLRRLASAAGFEVLELRSTHFNPIVIWQDFWRPRADVPNAERARLLGRTTRLKQAPALGPVRWAYRQCERALGAIFLADNLTAVLRRA